MASCRARRAPAASLQSARDPPMPRPVAAIVLAAGKGARMKSDTPKVLHKVAGRPMIGHVLAALEPLRPDPPVVVVAPGHEAVAEAARAAAPRARIAVQAEPRGTGDAVRAALPELAGFSGTVLVAFGDTPLATTETLARLAAAREGADPPGVVVLGFEADDPARYGLVETDSRGRPERIVEFAERGPPGPPPHLCNGGAMAADGARLAGWIAALRADNAGGERYLTDILEIARRDGGRAALAKARREELVGVDSRAGLARAEALMQRRLRAAAMEGGATLVAPETVFLSHDTEIGRDTTVHPHVVFGPGARIGPRVEVRSFSHIEGAVVAEGAIVGPHARLRPGAEIGAGAHIGNFVEVKAAEIGAGAKANHLAYIGDAGVGAGANIGAGTITCNYDGVAKRRTEIGAGAFIGSNVALVAPVAVGDGAIVGAGSTVAAPVEAGALAVARAAARTVPGGAARFRARREKARRARDDDDGGGED